MLGGCTSAESFSWRLVPRVQAAAQRGSHARSEAKQAEAAELSRLESMVLEAEGDLGKMRQRLTEPVGASLSLDEARTLHATVQQQLEALEAK